ncbi:hypothetical protein TVAG_121260 [Trichomonas vaginalis G3]|uniref:Uncharacterized protein n=1 Tax=Trichomonas vaginalis (strain ATCC PRA-98 / G3) TaxID=412133 RepID=A2G0D3_TRIV3|nr:protein ubiquitination [Trichomonas vaginalis G3]EAX89382.1 hypothetical protein TVAG_121260 [Trichomonas vaginalis G3]KAI5491312.1 protein ubiquitination [Trichomonas vaginalis G3]|eukprot:XP_001302312.1 hypothetical protein [Trichomonas vaginalis G3]
MISKACEEGLSEKIINDDNILHIASFKGNTRLVKNLIECGCKLEIRKEKGYTPLICASRNGHLELVKYLISVGTDKEAKNKIGGKALIYASFTGQLEVVKFLYTKKGDLTECQISSKSDSLHGKQLRAIFSHFG